MTGVPAMRRLLVLAPLLLPTLLVAGWAAQLTLARASQPALRVAITGYDPRDLLRGHYLQFRLDLPATEAACACLRPNPADALRPVVEAAACTLPPAGDCRHRIDAPGQPFRYYTSEERALALEAELAGGAGAASVLVHFHGDGAVSFSDVAVEPPSAGPPR